MNHSINSYDKEYIAELMAAFPVHETLSPDQALDLVSTRFDRLNTESFIKTLQTLDEQAYSRRLVQFPRVLHRYLFSSILNQCHKRIDSHNYEQYSVATFCCVSLC